MQPDSGDHHFDFLDPPARSTNLFPFYACFYAAANLILQFIVLVTGVGGNVSAGEPVATK